MYKAAPGPKIAEWMLRPAKAPSCLDPGKKEYEVGELEAAVGCETAAAEKVRGQLYSLQKVVKEAGK